MKSIKFYPVLILLLLINNYHCESNTIVNFKAIDLSNNSQIKFDSIVITNITKNLKKTIATDSVDLDLIFTSVEDNNTNLNQRLFVTLNSPNPFESTTDFKIYKIMNSNVSIRVYDLIGNLILRNSFYLENGIHDFTLDLESAAPGIYFLSIYDGSERNTLKLIKSGNQSGNASSIQYKGIEPMKIFYTGHKKTNTILNLYIDFYSFECYAKGYNLVSIYNSIDDKLELTMDTILINFDPKKYYNINLGYIDIGGISFKHKLHKQEQMPHGGGLDTTIYFDSIYNLQHEIYNRYLPQDDDWYYDDDGHFLSCLIFIDDSLITDFCYKTFTQNLDYNNGNKNNSSTMLTRIYFNIDLQEIDSINFMFYEHNEILGTPHNPYSSFEDINTQINLFNLPFTIEDQNNINIDIEGKAITDVLSLKYSRDKRYQWGGSNTGSEEESIIGIDTVSNDSHIKIILSQK